MTGLQVFIAAAITVAAVCSCATVALLLLILGERP